MNVALSKHSLQYIRIQLQFIVDDRGLTVQSAKGPVYDWKGCILQYIKETGVGRRPSSTSTRKEP